MNYWNLLKETKIKIIEKIKKIVNMLSFVKNDSVWFIRAIRKIY